MFKHVSDHIRQRVKDAYAAIADQYDGTHQTAWRGFEDLSHYVKRGAEVLDIGCGNGWLFGFFKDKSIHYLGIDNSSAMLELARSHFPEARFQLGDMIDLNVPPNSIDVVFSLATLHHISGKNLRQKSIGEIHHALRDNGILVLTVWNLFQWKFLAQWAVSILSFIFHLGLKYAWNDLWIPWRNVGPKRYLHAFLPNELLSYFNKGHWSIEEIYFMRKGSRVKFNQSKNLILVARKTHG